MAERFNDIRSPERQSEQSKSEKLEVTRSAEHSTEAGKFDRDKTVEAAREQLKKVEHKPAPEPTERQKQTEPQAEPVGKKAKRDVFERQMSKVRAQLPSTSRAFSKVVHNRVVEDVSEFLEDTVLRPPLLITGAVIGLLFSIVVYVVAQIQGIRLSGSEVVIGFAAGWALGAVGETVVRTLKRKRGQ